MGYKDGKYQFGQQEIEVRGDQAWVAGTSTLTGSVATMQRSVTKFLKYVKPPPQKFKIIQLNQVRFTSFLDTGTRGAA